MLRFAGKRLAEEGKPLVSEGFGQDGGVCVNQVERQPVFPRLQRDRSDQSRLSGEGGGLPDDETCLLAETRSVKVFCPVEAGGVGGEVGLLPSVVSLMDVLLVRVADMLFGDGVLQFDDVRATRVAVAEFRELQDRRDVSSDTCCGCRAFPELSER